MAIKINRTFLVVVTIATLSVAAWFLYSSRTKSIPLEEAVGAYSWDLQTLYPPGSPVARNVARQLTNYVGKIHLDHYVYVRLASSNVSSDISSDEPLVWDFPLTDQQRKEWKKAAVSLQQIKVLKPTTQEQLKPIENPMGSTE